MFHLLNVNRDEENRREAVKSCEAVAQKIEGGDILYMFVLKNFIKNFVIIFIF